MRKESFKTQITLSNEERRKEVEVHRCIISCLRMLRGPLVRLTRTRGGTHVIVSEFEPQDLSKNAVRCVQIRQGTI